MIVMSNTVKFERVFSLILSILIISSSAPLLADPEWQESISPTKFIIIGSEELSVYDFWEQERNQRTIVQNESYIYSESKSFIRL
jgi:hypothetical protein